MKDIRELMTCAENDMVLAERGSSTHEQSIYLVLSSIAESLLAIAKSLDEGLEIWNHQDPDL